MMLPTLKALADGKAHTMRELSESVAGLMHVPEADRQEHIASGTQSKWYNRLAWVTTHFSFAGLITRPVRGQVQITQRGSTALLSDPKRIE